MQKSHKYLGLGDTKRSAQERTESIQLVDFKNGYLRAVFPASEGYVELAVFRRADRSALVAVSAVARQEKDGKEKEPSP